MLPPLFLAFIAVVVVLVILWATGVFNKKTKDYFSNKEVVLEDPKLWGSDKYPYQRTATGYKSTGVVGATQGNGYPVFLNTNFNPYQIVFSQGVYLPFLDATDIPTSLPKALTPSQMFLETLRNTDDVQNQAYCMRYSAIPTFKSNSVMSSNTSDVASQVTNNWKASVSGSIDIFSASGSIDSNKSNTAYLSDTNTLVQQDLVNYYGELNQIPGHPECFLDNLNPQFLADFYVLSQQFLAFLYSWSMVNDEHINNSQPGYIDVNINDPFWNIFDTFFKKYGSHICTSETFGAKATLSYSDQQSTESQTQDISNTFCAGLGISFLKTNFCTGSSISDQSYVNSVIQNSKLSATGGSIQGRGALAGVSAIDIINKDVSAIRSLKTFMQSDPNSIDSGLEYQFTAIWEIIGSVMKDWFLPVDDTMIGIPSVPTNIQQMLMATLPVQYQDADAINNWLNVNLRNYSTIRRPLFVNLLMTMTTAYTRFTIGDNSVTFSDSLSSFVDYPINISNTNYNLPPTFSLFDKQTHYGLSISNLSNPFQPFPSCSPFQANFLMGNKSKDPSFNTLFKFDLPDNSPGYYYLTASVDNGSTWATVLLHGCGKYLMLNTTLGQKLQVNLYKDGKDYHMVCNQPGYGIFNVTNDLNMNPPGISFSDGRIYGNFNPTSNSYQKTHVSSFQLQNLNGLSPIPVMWNCPIPNLPCDFGTTTNYSNINSCIYDCDYTGSQPCPSQYPTCVNKVCT